MAERVCYASMAVYLATYLLASYGVSLQVLAVALVAVALGNLLGTTLGGQLADRIGSRTLLASACLAATALLAIPLLGWPGGLALSVGSFFWLWWTTNMLSAHLAGATIAFYVLVYTLLLKRRTSQNIVVNMPGPAAWIGRTVRVAIERAGAHSVWGQAGRDAN